MRDAQVLADCRGIADDDDAVARRGVLRLDLDDRWRRRRLRGGWDGLARCSCRRRLGAASAVSGVDDDGIGGIAERLLAQRDRARDGQTRQSAATDAGRCGRTTGSERGAAPAERRRPTCPSGRSMSLVRCVKPAATVGLVSKLLSAESNCRNLSAAGSDRMITRQDAVRLASEPYWFMTALSGFGGKAGSVFTPRSSSSA